MDALTNTELIRKLDIFEPLDEKIIKNISKMCIEREFALGEYIVKRGESGLGLYFITNGRAKVEIDRDGVKIIVAELHGGDFLGELSMIDDNVRSADVICIENTTCLLLTRDSFSKLLKKYPEIALQMAKALVARIRATNEKVGSTAMATPVPSAFGPEPVSEPATLAAAVSDNSLSLPDFNLQKTFSYAKDTTQQAIDSYSSTKHKTRDFLVDLFGSWYFLKMMTRFSAALVACPVEVQPEELVSEVLQISINGVKLALFPASSHQILRIAAFDEGDFTATVFRSANCGGPSVTHFEGRVRKNETLRLHVPLGENTWLERL